MFVTKRDGRKEPVDFEKVNRRLTHLNEFPTQLRVNATFIAQKVISEIVDGIETRLLDEHAARVASDMGAIHPDFSKLAARIAISNHQKNTHDCFSKAMDECYRNRTAADEPAPRINQQFHKFVQIHKNELNKMIDYNRDFRFSYFGFTTLLDRYLIKRSGPADRVKVRPQDFVIERPQDLWLRVSCAVHMNRDDISDAGVLDAIKQTYDLLSGGKISLATPMLYNSGTNCEQLLSCFLCAGDDSIEGIFRLVSNVAKISKYAGGIGFWWDLRSEGSDVKSTNGVSSGMIPFLDVVAKTAAAVDQGGKRKGSMAHYIEPQHPDFARWLELKRPTGSGRIHDLFYALWCPDIFMRYVHEDRLWYFFDPHDCPRVYNLYGDEFDREYESLVEQKRYRGEPVRARRLWEDLIQTQIETGMPYVLFKDAANHKSNQRNVGVIKSSNLCAEILEYSSPEEYACCVVSAMCLPEYVVTAEDGTKSYDFDSLARNTGTLVEILNKIIDINYYPVEEARRSNLRHRPLAIGVQGLADVFHALKMPFTSDAARDLNRKIFESIYYGALRASCDLAKRYGAYETFAGSPFSEGLFQWNLWNLKGGDLMGKWDWAGLREDVIRYGVRNSLLTSLPPTASTSQIQGNNECFEPYTDNLYVRKTLSGEFTVVNHHLVEDLIHEGLWTADTRNELIRGRGSVQQMSIPAWMKELYRTAWELESKKLIDMDAERAPFIDQTQSSNRFMLDPNLAKLSSMHFYCWRKGLKTGMYYLRSLSNSKPKQFSEAPQQSAKKVICTEDVCVSCSV